MGRTKLRPGRLRRSQPPAAIEGERLPRILVPIDFSGASRLAVGYALALADATGAEVVLLHVIDERTLDREERLSLREAFATTVDPTGSTYAYEAWRGVIDDDAYADAQRKLMALLPPLCGDQVRTLVAVGDVAEKIINVARQERVTLLVMGVHGRRRWRRLVLERVAERVVQRSPANACHSAGRITSRQLMPPPWG
jgi:nucleotide-binding universal stress UspA family protein